MISFYGRILCRAMIFPLFIITGACLFSGCGGESDTMVRKKLEVICKNDLAAIIDSIAVENLLKQPCYKVVFFKKYSEGTYTFKAVVDFYFLKKVRVKVVRKYRYHASIRMWDRYYNEYVFLADSTTTVPQK